MDEAEQVENKNKELLEKLKVSLRLKNNLKPHGDHLDFGCGWGFFTKVFAENYPLMKVDGFDVDCERIENAKMYRKMNNVEYFCHSNEKNYDSVSAIFVLHEVENLKKVLSDLVGRLRDGGKIIILDFKKTSKAKFRELFDKEWDEEDDFEDEYKEHNQWTLEEFEDILDRVGFKKIESGEDDHYLMYLGEK